MITYNGKNITYEQCSNISQFKPLNQILQIFTVKDTLALSCY